MSLAGVFTHNRCRHRIVAANADSKYETETDEPPDVRREGTGDGARSKNENFDAVDSFAAEHIRHTAKEQRTESRRQQSRRGDKTFLDFADLPHRFEQGHDHADDE